MQNDDEDDKPTLVINLKDLNKTSNHSLDDNEKTRIEFITNQVNEEKTGTEAQNEVNEDAANEDEIEIENSIEIDNDEDEDDKATSSHIDVSFNTNQDELSSLTVEGNDGSLVQQEDDFDLSLSDDSLTLNTAIAFNYKTAFFDNIEASLSSDFNVIRATTLEELNSLLTQRQDISYLFFYFHSEPKDISILLKQMNAKFPQIKTVLFVNNLSPAKMEKHKQTSSAASVYVSCPYNEQELKSKLA